MNTYWSTGVGKDWSGVKVRVCADGARITLTILRSVDGGGCDWHGVSLTPLQAISVANRLRSPLPDEWIDFANPEPLPARQGETRAMWDVFKVKHSNGVHDARLGIKKNIVAIADGLNYLPSSGKTDSFWHLHSKKLTDSEVKRLAGLLYYWAGAKMVGKKTVKKQTKRVLLKTGKGDR